MHSACQESSIKNCTPKTKTEDPLENEDPLRNEDPLENKDPLENEDPLRNVQLINLVHSCY